jgi:choline dehydrogenase-like flavoprotein
VHVWAPLPAGRQQDGSRPVGRGVMQHEFDAIVVGGGFFGCSLALHLRRKAGLRVVVLEAGADLMQRASYVNQARVHNG